ncbi:MAG TPA: YfiR family protein [Terracidiphilus sp.]|jgi:hypothetical protein
MAWLVVWAALAAVNSSAQQTKPTEYQVKAAYIYNFGKFVKWPTTSVANQNPSFTICVLGQDSFGAVLQSTLTGEAVGGRPVAVKRILRAGDGVNCHILFLNTGEADHLNETLAALGHASVLTVSDIPEFAQRGGMIQFVLQGDRVRFEINRANAENSGLTLTSDLLKVAVAVRGSVRKGAQ